MDKNMYEIKMKKLELKAKIRECKRLLRESDYKAIKYAEGELSEEEYIPTRIERKEWRDTINSCEAQINIL